MPRLDLMLPVVASLGLLLTSAYLTDDKVTNKGIEGLMYIDRDTKLACTP